MNLLGPFVEEHDEPRLYQLARLITEEFEKYTSWQVYPDVIPVLETLKAHKYTLGVISDWGIALGPILRSLHLTHYFDSFLIPPSPRHSKPSPPPHTTPLHPPNTIP